MKVYPPWIVFLVMPFVLLLCLLLVFLTGRIDSEGRHTYEYAGYNYPPHAKFDNTWLTWSTDYLITAVLFTQGMYIHSLRSLLHDFQSLVLILLGLYGGSTFVGGLAHQMYSGDTEDLNSVSFYLMWIVVVGFTAIAGGVQGRIGDELLMIHGYDRIFSSKVWYVWSYLLLIIIALGGFSCIRPACDIFVAGVTQSIPVFYLQYCMYKTIYQLKSLSRFDFSVLFVGSIFNAPLIVLYPYLLELFGPPITNALLHLNLLVSWGSQGYGYYKALYSIPRNSGFKHQRRE